MNNNQSIQNIYESQKKSLQRKIFNFLPRIFNFPLISCKKQIAKRKRRKKEHKIKYSKNTLHRFTYNTTTITTTITTTAFRQKKKSTATFSIYNKIDSRSSRRNLFGFRVYALRTNLAPFLPFLPTLIRVSSSLFPDSRQYRHPRCRLHYPRWDFGGESRLTEGPGESARPLLFSIRDRMQCF